MVKCGGDIDITWPVLLPSCVNAPGKAFKALVKLLLAVILDLQIFSVLNRHFDELQENLLILMIVISLSEDLAQCLHLSLVLFIDLSLNHLFDSFLLQIMGLYRREASVAFLDYLPLRDELPLIVLKPCLESLFRGRLVELPPH